MKKRVLISVSDKTNIIEFAKKLIENNYEIISTGGTKKILEDNDIKSISVSEVTGFPEILDGRVKTLHPNVHGGLLSVRDNPDHIKQNKENNIEYIDMVVVNLYPFKKTISNPDVKLDDAIENIDIGGPSMLRSAAKNNKFVTVICDPNDYNLVIGEIDNISDKTKKKLAAKAFRHTASYDSIIANYLTKEFNDDQAKLMTLTFDLKQNLRYGENPHQKAKFYSSKNVPFSLTGAKQLQGKELSYNNINDANTALQITREFNDAVIVAVKHMNPCGVGIGKNINEAFKKAYESDSTSIFGGIICTNRKMTKTIANELNKIFLEIIIAPDFENEALKIFKKKNNLRVLKVDMIESNELETEIKSVSGGLLVQELDKGKVKPQDYKVVTKIKPDENIIKELEFAWKCVKHAKSNAIVVTKNGATVGIGVGQMNRIASAEIALKWAARHGHNNNLVLASDAFFPFSDVVELANQYGVNAIIQPGGSIRDKDSITVCDKHKMSMVFTGMRHFKH